MSAASKPPVPPLSPNSAWFSLAHLQIQQSSAILLDVDSLELSESEALLLHQSLQPLFAEDGFDLQYFAGGSWILSTTTIGTNSNQLAKAVDFSKLPSLSELMQYQGQELMDYLPADSRLPKLLAEVQMLLYHHAVNTEREALGKIAVNTFVLHRPAAARLPFWRKLFTKT